MLTSIDVYARGQQVCKRRRGGVVGGRRQKRQQRQYRRHRSCRQRDEPRNRFTSSGRAWLNASALRRAAVLARSKRSARSFQEKLIVMDGLRRSGCRVRSRLLSAGMVWGLSLSAVCIHVSRSNREFQSVSELAVLALTPRIPERLRVGRRPFRESTRLAVLRWCCGAGVGPSEFRTAVVRHGRWLCPVPQLGIEITEKESSLCVLAAVVLRAAGGAGGARNVASQAVIYCRVFSQ